MNLLRSPYNRFLWPAIFLSLLVHIAIFNTFIISFPKHPEAFKPKLIFLGSFLQKHETSEHGSLKQSETTKVPSKSHHFESVEINDNPFMQLETHKPFPNEPSKSPEKRTIKTSFELPQLNDKKEDAEYQDIGIETDLPPYRPLGLRQNDNN